MLDRNCPQPWNQTHMFESGHFNLTIVCSVTLDKPLLLLDPIFPRSTITVTNFQGVGRIENNNDKKASPEKLSEMRAAFFFFSFNFYCYSITVVCLFSPSFHPHPNRTHLAPPPLPSPLILSMCPL